MAFNAVDAMLFVVCFLKIYEDFNKISLMLWEQEVGGFSRRRTNPLAPTNFINVFVFAKCEAIVTT